jgi:hypothetical protein
LEPRVLTVDRRIPEDEETGVVTGHQRLEGTSEVRADTTSLIDDDEEVGGVDALHGRFVVLGRREPVGDHRAVQLPLGREHLTGQVVACGYTADVGPQDASNLPVRRCGGDDSGGAGGVATNPPCDRSGSKMGFAGGVAGRDGGSPVVSQRLENLNLFRPEGFAESFGDETDRVVLVSSPRVVLFPVHEAADCGAFLGGQLFEDCDTVVRVEGDEGVDDTHRDSRYGSQ